MKFNGMMVTDYNVVTDIKDLHHAAADYTQATQLMINRTSIDMAMLGNNGDVYFNALVGLVKSGAVPVSAIIGV
jgi:beta-glucosidase-like glycosyl hydrolase